ncbi:MAG: glycoside hydrolase family 27 protein [Acidobacteriaceae bacterium]|nr:glycoside hydrolase family 27 protein [Acidobacteriaceae bacterium]
MYAQSGISGVWRYEVHRQDDTIEVLFLNLNQQGSSVTGDVIENYHPRHIRNGSYTDGKLHAEISRWGEQVIDYDGALAGDRLELTISRKDNSSSPPHVTQAVATRSTEDAIRLPAPLPLPELHDVPDNGLVRTPPMGWNSWNHFAGRVNDKVVRAAADAVVSSGMKDAGYVYINIDDTWEAGRDANGNIQTNKKFPDMKALADYVHSKGLKIGIYSSPGPLTCAGYEASYGHEEQDAKTYASWGFDYLKYDWCSAGEIYKDGDMRPVYQKMGDALQASGRPIVFSLCQYGREDVWTWGAKVGGNLWRTTGDISDNWESMSTIGFSQMKIAEYATPGRFNDPDMLEVGNGGMTDDEYRVHFSLWAMLSAPLLAGNDLEKMSKSTLAILTNKEVIAVDQDPAVHHAKQIAAENSTEIWAREMHDGSTVVTLFNRGDQPAKMTVEWSKSGLGTPTGARNLWTHEDVNLSGDTYAVTVPRHAVVMLRVPKS